MTSRVAEWHAEDIKAALRKKYGPITRLSRSWGYSHTAITSTIARSDYSIPVERRIAQALDVAPNTLWPNRWSPDGNPQPRPVAQTTTSRRASPHRQKRDAA